jgi:twitching motility protein PilT
MLIPLLFEKYVQRGSEMPRFFLSAGDPESGFFVITGEDAKHISFSLRMRHGERITLRLLETGGRRLGIGDLGMSAADRATFEKTLDNPQGLLLLTGPTGSGKSSTLAAMLDYINHTRRRHIITLENPIEFVYEHDKCIVNQREVGDDTGSFAAGLRAALRQDPDVILVGEMRDLETFSTAITAAETGHLVFGTLHTKGAANSIDRVIDVFPPAQQEQIRIQLADVLECVVTKALLPKIGGGRVAAYEILVATPAVRSLIRQNKSFQIPSAMQTGKRQGMQTLDDALADLVRSGQVTMENALSVANDAVALEGQFRRF